MYGSADDNEKWVQCDECEARWDMTWLALTKNIALTTFVCEIYVEMLFVVNYIFCVNCI